MAIQHRQADYMVRNEFRKEPTLGHFKRVWLENKGNWLLATGVVVSALAWLVGYFDLIPEIRANRRPIHQSMMATGSTLIVRVVGCQSDEGQVVAMLYDAESFNPEAIALRVETLEIENHQAVWPVHNLSFGSYVVLAFHDINADEQFQPTVERQGVSVGSEAPVVPGDEGQAPPVDSHAAFTFFEDAEEVVIQLK